MYQYDAGGRMTTVSNSGQNLNIRYNVKDQVASITNGSANSVYSYDSGGRRVRASDNNGATVRQFVLDSTGDGGLDSPVFITDGSGVLQQGYAYADDLPLFRYDASGNVTYYLEDAMGSVIGLAPDLNPTTGTTTTLFYDGFGRTRGTNGPAPAIATAVGGDFRYHGAWLETATELYYMRARDYDFRSGRFVSRDPGEGDFRIPESLNPYAYALNNPYLYTDPSGEFSMTEITLVGAINFILQTLKTVAVAEFKGRAIEAITDLITSVVLNQLPLFGIPIEFTKIEKWMAGRDPKELGNLAELAIWEATCWLLNQTGAEFPKAMHHAVRVADSRNSDRSIVGKPLSRGRNCQGANPPAGRGMSGGKFYSLPDLIFGMDPPLKPKIPGIKGAKGVPNKTELDGEVKLRATTLFADYVIPGRKKEQLHAILAYAGRWTNWRVSIFIVGIEDKKLRFVDRKVKQADEAALLAKGLKRGVLSLYVPIKGLPEPK
jgi:RHS repeat-associated protein